MNSEYTPQEIEFNPYTFEYDMSNWDKYCSFCGAKMDEDGEQK